MQKPVEEAINNGLGLFTRTLLGLVAGGFSVAMVGVTPPDGRSVFFYTFAVLCLSVSAACFLKGRARQFFGSIVGLLIFLVSIVYVADQLAYGELISDRTEPSLINALAFMFCFGVPGIGYVYKARFGFARQVS